MTLKSINGIMGLALGDAMGLPYGTMDRNELFNNPVTKMNGYKRYDLPKGTWSNNTSMTLATIDSINSTLGIDLKDIANRFLDWMKCAKYTPSQKVIGIGKTVLQSLAVYEVGDTEPEKCGSDQEQENGSDSIVRMLPIAYYSYCKKLKRAEIFDIVSKVSSITHAHEISIMGCFLYVLYAIELIDGSSKEEAYDMIRNINYRDYFSRSTVKKYNRILKNNIFEYDLDTIKTTGYVIDTLEASLWVLFNTENFNSAIIGAVNLGGDTDKVASCTGGLAGILYGLQTMNVDWKIDLVKYEYIKKFCEKFDRTLAIL